MRSKPAPSVQPGDRAFQKHICKNNTSLFDLRIALTRSLSPHCQRTQLFSFIIIVCYTLNFVSFLFQHCGISIYARTMWIPTESDSLVASQLFTYEENIIHTLIYCYLCVYISLGWFYVVQLLIACQSIKKFLLLCESRNLHHFPPVRLYCQGREKGNHITAQLTQTAHPFRMLLSGQSSFT